MQTEKQIDPVAYWNAQNRVMNDKLFVFYKGIDFLTVKISTALPIICTLNGLVENSDTYMLEHGFRILFFGLVAGSQLKVLHVVDSRSNLIAFLHIKQHSEKKNRNFSTDIEFTGLFWTAYSDYLDYFCSVFDIDRKKPRIVSRIDYCIDLGGIDVPTLQSYLRDPLIRGHSYHVENELTYRNLKGDRHELVLYNKRLDVLEKGKHKITVDGDDPTPYVKYLPWDPWDNYPISRIEYRKRARALRELADNSIDGLFLYIEQMTVDYFARYYHFDIGYILRNSSDFVRRGKPIKVDNLSKRMLAKKLAFNRSMVSAYLTNCEKLSSKKKVYRYLYERYGKPLYRYGDQKYGMLAIEEDLSPKGGISNADGTSYDFCCDM